MPQSMDPLKIIQAYAVVFGRAPAVVRESELSPLVRCCWFPAMEKPGFWKRLSAELPYTHVWITAGLSHLTATAENEEGAAGQKIELVAMADNALGAGTSGNEDTTTMILERIATYVLECQVPVGLGHTIDFGEAWATNTAMTGCFLTLPFGFDQKRVRRCSGASELLGVMPLTAAELEYTRKNGVEALLEKLESADIPPAFDVFRPSLV